MIVATIIWDRRVLSVLIVAGVIALIVGEAADLWQRRRDERLRLRLGHLVTDTRFDEPMTLSPRPRDWQQAGLRVGRAAGRFLPRRIVASYGALLLRAGLGEPAMLPLLFAVKLSSALVGALLAGALAAALLPPGLGPVLLLGAGGLLIGYLLPDLWLQQRIGAYASALRAAVPSGIDLLVIALQAGLSFDGAVGHLSTTVDDPFAREMRVYMRLRSLGYARKAALTQVAERSDLVEMRTFTTAVAQGEQLGIGIAALLHDIAMDLRIRYKQRIATQVQTASVRMLFPIVACILPAIFIVLLGPAVGAIAGSFG